jgi:hypothetical protein
MSRRDRTTTHSLDAAAIAKAVTEQLPGWKLSRTQAVAEDAAVGAAARLTPGPTIAELRRKFLGDAADGADSVEAGAAPSATRIKSVLIEPEDGGPAKVADFVDGKLTIVQG